MLRHEASKDDRIKMTEWDDCKRYIFSTLNLTERDNCKRKYDFEFDRKRLKTTVNIYRQSPIF